MGALRINETPSDNTYCILNHGDVIETFYFERGGKFELKVFAKDATAMAIAHFEEWVLSDQTIRKNWDGVVR